jgi:uncharacterized protein YkwD
VLRSSATRRLRRLVAVPVVLAAAVAVPATASAATCAGANRSPGKLGEAGVRHTTLCLLNRQRAAHGLSALRADHRLATAALGHSKDMVAHRYFAHESRSGAPFSSRIVRTGWTRSRRSYVIGENIGWGTGNLATPRAMVRAWMHSAPHRANILERRYRVIGIGVAFGVPVAGSGGATYSTDFGG